MINFVHINKLIFKVPFIMKNIKQILMIVACTLATSTLFAQNDWAGFNRYDADNKALQTAPKVVFMGNSITEGWWNNDPDFFKVNNYLGRGISGQTSSQMLVRFRTDVINLKPKAVVILAGTNDIAQNTGYIALENILGVKVWNLLQKLLSSIR